VCKRSESEDAVQPRQQPRRTPKIAVQESPSYSPSPQRDSDSDQSVRQSWYSGLAGQPDKIRFIVLLEARPAAIVGDDTTGTPGKNNNGRGLDEKLFAITNPFGACAQG
jgi:hypothetical protein